MGKNVDNIEKQRLAKPKPMKAMKKDAHGETWVGETTKYPYAGYVTNNMRGACCQI